MADSGRIVNGAWMPAVDTNGYPIPDAYIRVFVNRTTTLASIYADEARTTLLPNPVYADSSGQFPPIWQDSALMFSLEFGSVSKGPIATVDDLQPSSNIGGASDKLDKDGGNAAPDILTNIAAAAVTGDNITDPDTFRANVGAASEELRQATYVHLLDVVPKSLWAALRTPASSPTNMTPYILAAAAKLPKGGVIRADGGLFLRLRTLCVLPTGVSLWAGDDAPDEPVPVAAGDYTQAGSQLLYDEDTDYGGFGVVLRVGLGASGYSGFTIRPYTFTPRYETKAEFMAAKAAHFSKTFSNHVGPGGRVHHNLYLGCNIGHDAYNIERPYVDNNRGDCNTLIKCQTITDWGGIHSNHKWPFSCAHQSWTDSETVQRAGPSHTLWDVADWTQVFRPMSFGGDVAMDVRNSDNTSVLHFGFDGFPPAAGFGGGMTDAWYAANPTQGLRYTGTIRRASAMDGMISSQTYGVSVDINSAFSDTIHLTNVRVAASRDYAYLPVHGNITSVNGSSYAYPGIGTLQTHVALGAEFGALNFIGHTFESGLDFQASSEAKLREVQLVGCTFKNMTEQNAYTQQLQGVLYIRGDDTSKAGKNLAAMIIENRAATTAGTATGQAWRWAVGNDGRLILANVSHPANAVWFDPATNHPTFTSRIFGTAGIGNDFWLGVNGGTEPTNLGLGIRVSAPGVVADVFSYSPQGARSLTKQTVGADIAGTAIALTAADFKTLRRTANIAATTITLPANAPAGSYVDIIQGSTGQVTFAAGSGGTVVGYPGVKTAGLYATVRATVHNNSSGSNAAWYISGACAA